MLLLILMPVLRLDEALKSFLVTFNSCWIPRHFKELILTHILTKIPNTDQSKIKAHKKSFTPGFGIEARSF